jgi:hypothetical protein
MTTPPYRGGARRLSLWLCSAPSCPVAAGAAPPLLVPESPTSRAPVGDARPPWRVMSGRLFTLCEVRYRLGSGLLWHRRSGVGCGRRLLRRCRRAFPRVADPDAASAFRNHVHGPPAASRRPAPLLKLDGPRHEGAVETPSRCVAADARFTVPVVHLRRVRRCALRPPDPKSRSPLPAVEAP